jgi:regulation of enolase protein 1 (concanavalin A-like superfamily)
MKRLLALESKAWERGVRRVALMGVALTTVAIGLASCATTSQQTTTPAASVTSAPSALAQSCRSAAPGTQANLASAAIAPVADDLTPLSDEFDQAGTLAQWKDLATVEKFPSKVARLDINTSSPGQLYIEPYTSTWFEDYRGVFLYKEVTGDYMVTARVRASGKASDTPTSIFSLSGLMSRAPRNITMDSWTPHGENWLFIATGYGNGGIDGPQFETKTTTNSASDLWLTPSRADWVNLRVLRLGEVFLMLYRFTGGPWTLSRCFDRPDLPQTLQVGVHAYTDWNTITTRYPDDPEGFNRATLTGPDTHPDLIARDDYVRFQRPAFPGALKARVAAGAATVEDILNSLG